MAQTIPVCEFRFMSDLFFRNRRLLILSVALLVVAGLSSLMVLPRLEDPVLRQRAALIHTLFPGARAARVESLVTEVLEEALQEIEEIRVLRSGSRDGHSTITMELEDYVIDVDNVWSRVRDKLNDASGEIEATGALPPVFVDLRFSAYAMLISLSADETVVPPDSPIVQRYADLLEQKLRSVPGTDDVDIFGRGGEEITVEVNQQQLAARGMTVDQVASALFASDAKISSGGLINEQQKFVVELDSEFDSLSRIAATPLIAEGDGRTVTLADVATVTKSLSHPPGTITRIDDRRAVVLGCFIEPSMRIDLWTAEVEKRLAVFRKELPSTIRVEPLFVQERFVTARLEALLKNLILAGVAVLVVVFLMMGLRSALIVSTSLPLTSMIVLGGLRMMGIPLDQMSITGLIIALGLLIDNAIVAAEEMRQILRTGVPATAAIRQTFHHLAIPLFGSTFTTCLAFAPLALMPGPAGEFVGSIGISVIIAVVGSLFVALFIVTALSGILATSGTAGASSGFLQNGLGNQWMYDRYRKLLEWTVRHPGAVIPAGILIPLSGFLALRYLPEQFFPSSDRNQMLVTLQESPGTGIAETEATARSVRRVMMEDPDVVRVHWFIGESAPAFFYNMLPVRSELSSYAQAMVEARPGTNMKELVGRIQTVLERHFPETHLIARQLEQGPPVEAPIAIRIFGPDLTELRRIGDEIRLIASGIRDVIGTSTDAGNTAPQVRLTVDEPGARTAGLSQGEIANQLRGAFDGGIGGSMVESTEVIPVRIRLGDGERGSIEGLSSFDLVSRGGDGMPVRVPAEAVMRKELVPGNASIERLNGFRMNEVNVHVRSDVLTSFVLDPLRKAIEERMGDLPPGYSIDFAGESAERNRAVNNLMASAGVLAVLMIAGLVLSFRSFALAGMIALVAVLSAGLGLQAIWIFGYPFGFMSIVGIMGLVGVAVNDSIVVIAGLQGDPAVSAGDRSAMIPVVFRSTRHVLSTTLTTVVGFAPLMLGGGGFWPPLAVAIAGGVSGATAVALFLVPSLYAIIFCRQKPVPAVNG
jgi:multidrug efflux pump subunit AcrB